MARGVHGRGMCMAGGVGWGACMAGSMHGGAHGRGCVQWGHAWQGCIVWGCAWQGVCEAWGHVWQGRGATAVDGTHPTGMHSCINKAFSVYNYPICENTIDQTLI